MQPSQQRALWGRFEIKVITIILALASSLTVALYFLIYSQYHSLTLQALKSDAHLIHEYVEKMLAKESFTKLNTVEDEQKQIYLETQQKMDQIRRIANIRYLYTAKKNAAGEYIYLVDGLNSDAEDFRHVGMPIEKEIIPLLEKSLRDEVVLGDDIMVTEWGTVYVTYFPVHDDDGRVIGAIGMEFECENIYNANRQTRLFTILLSAALAVTFSCIAIVALRRLVGRTEDALHKKDELLIAAKEDALASSAAKGEFLSRMSHEIRTPMNAIIGMTTIAAKTNDVGRMRYCLERIDNTSKQLLDIINDILDMSKIEANKFEIGRYEFDFEKMLQRVFNVVHIRADEKHQKLEFDCKEVFTRAMASDELRLSQVLINLLGNAVKFTPEGGNITLVVRHTPKDGSSSLLHFAVKDSGIGMSEEELSRLFQRFEQADGGITRKFGGTGLGLAISKKIVALMGGNITVTSEPGNGSCFMFDIEVSWGKELKNRAFGYAKDNNDALRVLVVDDEQVVLEYFSSVLKEFSIACDCASSGGEAVEMVFEAVGNEKPYDLVFLDWNMPDLNGGQTAIEIKRIMNDNIIVVMISALDWADIEKQASAIGIACFLPKPVLPSIMLSTIMEQTNRSLSCESSGEKAIPCWSAKRILLVDDVLINQEIVIGILEETGVRIDCASDGVEAVEAFHAGYHIYDAILMDVQMPRMDGLSATRKIRSSGLPTAETIPIIAMTANAFKEDVLVCLEAGMNSHVAKPIDVDKLLDLLLVYLKK